MNNINPNHQKEKSFLKTLGPLILFVGICFIAVGMISFFSSFGSFSPPKYFWCSFVGMPVMFVGIVMTKFGYMGKVARYTAAEVAPVGKDTFNYMAKETQEGVSHITQAIREGSTESEINSIESRITKLEQLRQKGLINDEDFEEQKDRILSEL